MRELNVVFIDLKKSLWYNYQSYIVDLEKKEILYKYIEVIKDMYDRTVTIVEQ